MRLTNPVIARLFVASLLGPALLARPAGAITFGQLDDFQDGTTMFWSGGAFPENVASGGPQGGSDKFLRITSNGGIGSGSRLATYNNIQWAGDYSSAGVSVVEMDLKNLGSVLLSMRAVLFGPTFSRWTSTIATDLPADGQWHHVSFLLAANDMTIVAGFDTFPATISGAAQLMVRHQLGAPGSQGTPVASQLGIDNVFATDQARVYPTGYSVTLGQQTGGTLLSLFYNDANRIQIQSDELAPDAQIEVYGQLPGSTPSRLRVTYDTASSRTDEVEKLQLWNWGMANWDATAVFSRAPTASDSTISYDVVQSIGRLISSNREVKARLSWFPIAERSDFDGWGARIDQLNWFYKP